MSDLKMTNIDSETYYNIASVQMSFGERERE
jgi:hypothetical protein